MVLIGNCIVCIKVFLKVMNLILRMKFDFFFFKSYVVRIFFYNGKENYIKIKVI